MARVAILGATGAVGEVVRSILHDRAFPVDELVCLASARSAGARVGFGDDEVEVRAVAPEHFEGVDVAIFSAGASRSREWAPVAVERGAIVVDNSSAFRMDPDVPLVVADVNPHAIATHRGVIANPNCSTMQLMPVLKVLRDAAGLERITVATYQSVSGTGQKAIDELQRQAALVLDGQPVEPAVYPKQIAFDVLPVAGSPSGDDGYTDEELKLVNESRKILELPGLRVSSMCARVPVVYAHSEAVWAETREPISAARFRELLAATDGIVVQDDLGAGEFPTANGAAGRDEVFVGRIRRDLGAENSLAFWCVSDNLRKGAALNAVQIAELLVKQPAASKR